MHRTEVNAINWHATKISKINFKSSIAVSSDKQILIWEVRADVFMCFKA